MRFFLPPYPHTLLCTNNLRTPAPPEKDVAAVEAKATAEAETESVQQPPTPVTAPEKPKLKPEYHTRQLLGESWRGYYDASCGSRASRFLYGWRGACARKCAGGERWWESRRYSYSRFGRVGQVFPDVFELVLRQNLICMKMHISLFAHGSHF